MIELKVKKYDFNQWLKAAVKQFQSDRGLKVDGIAGRNTILKLMGV